MVVLRCELEADIQRLRGEFRDLGRLSGIINCVFFLFWLLFISLLFWRVL
jgi:hypothetical protein